MIPGISLQDAGGFGRLQGKYFLKISAPLVLNLIQDLLRIWHEDPSRYLLEQR